MKIISGFHDYYDSCSAFGGIDTNIVYIRKTEIQDVIIKKINVTELLYNIANYYVVEGEDDFYCNYVGVKKIKKAFLPCVIGFCGKLYLAIASYDYHYRKSLDNIFDYNDFFIEFVYDQNEMIRRCQMAYGDKNRYFGLFSRQKVNVVSAFDEIQSWLDMSSNPFKECFFKWKTPVFMSVLVGHCSHIDRNYMKFKTALSPKLTDIKFQNVVDPWQAYQEIDMYLGNDLVNVDNQPIVVDDKTMVAAKGFDERSFRMDSPGKKKNRRNQ